jgi:hypothetical protein
LMVRGYVSAGCPARFISFDTNDLQLFWKTLPNSGFYLRANRIFRS